MSKKRTLADSNDDDQTNEGSESLCQKESNAKRLKVDSLISDKTLQDLPIGLLQCIIVKAVAMEVTSLKLAKAVWKEKADLVINRLMTVCSQWSSILTTDAFRAQLHRTLDGTGQEIRLEVLHELQIPSTVNAVTSMNDEIFLLCSPNDDDYAIDVVKRNNLGVTTAVIPLELPEGSHPVRMTACSVSNCLYVVVHVETGDEDSDGLSVFRVSKTGEHQFDITEVPTDQEIHLVSISANGSLAILPDFDVISIYDANDFLQRQVTLPPELDPLSCSELIQRPNGNLVLGFVDENDQTNLLEIDTSGSVVRQYRSSLGEECCVDFADNSGRIMITKPFEGIDLLDSELNLLGSYNLPEDDGKNLALFDLHYESEMNWIMRIHFDVDANVTVITIFRFTEE